MKAKLMGVVAAVILGAAAGVVSAADSLTTQATQMDSYAASRGQTAVTGRTAADFSSFYGQDNAQALAGGLRSGTEIHLAGGVSFTPPTGSMGNGNVYISMALAKQQLTAAGITQPTAEQIQAAMTGGTVQGPNGSVTFQGVLQMRASGMGWGQIAQAMGTKLGPVISGMKSANAALSATSAQTGSVSATAGTSDTAKPKAGAGRSGVATAGGSGGANVVDSKARGKSGIVTGAGAADGAPSPVGGAKSQGQGAGIVTGGGGGQGNAYGKGGKP